MQQNDKLKSMLGFAMKAGKVLFGSDNLLANGKRKYLIVICKSLSENGINRLVNNASTVPIIKTKNQLLSELTHKDNCKAIAFTDKQMANAVLNSYNNNEYELLSEGK